MFLKLWKGKLTNFLNPFNFMGCVWWHNGTHRTFWQDLILKTDIVYRSHKINMDDIKRSGSRRVYVCSRFGRMLKFSIPYAQSCISLPASKTGVWFNHWPHLFHIEIRSQIYCQLDNSDYLGTKSLHVYHIIVSNGINGSSGRDLSLTLRIQTGAQSNPLGTSSVGLKFT